MKIKTLLLSVSAIVVAAQVSRAELIDMQALWSGTSFGNGASATATFTLDTSFFPNPGSTMISGSNFGSAFQNFQLTVAGAASGNGVFTVSDFSAAYWNTGGGTLDFHSELVGQTTPGGLWGFSNFPPVGDFNIFGNISNPLAPQGLSAFMFSTGGVGGSSNLLLTSFAPVAPAPPVAAVPEAGTWVMGLLALGAMVFMARRNVLRA